MTDRDQTTTTTTTIERLERTGAALRGSDRLDDVTRARMWGRIEAQLARPAAGAPVPWSRRRAIIGGTAVAAAIAIAAAVAAIVIARGGASGDGELHVAADSTLATTLGGYTHASIVGPAVVAVTERRGDATTVALRSGTLVAEFAGGAGRTLTVEAPRMTVDIVGTVFAVEVGADRTCVSVAHGRVRARVGAREVFVGGGERACSDDAAATRSIEPRVQDLMQRQDALQIATTIASAGVGPRGSGLDGPVVAASANPAASEAAPTTSALSTAASNPAAMPAATSGWSNASNPAAMRTATSGSSNGSNPAAMPAATSGASNASNPAAMPTPAATSTSAAHAPGSAIVATSAKIDAAAARPGAARATNGPLLSTATVKIEPAKIGAPTSPATSSTAKVDAAQVDVAKADAAKADIAKADVARTEAAQRAVAQQAAEQRYEAAEAALRRRDPAAADRILAELVATAPGSALVDQAIFERARIAYQRHAWAEARARLAELAALATTPLTESGRFLACRVAVDSHDGDAARCLAEFRTAYRHSSHDLDALAMLATLAADCAAARPFVDELAVRYPHASETRRAQDRCR